MLLVQIHKKLWEDCENLATEQLGNIAHCVTQKPRQHGLKVLFNSSRPSFSSAGPSFSSSSPGPLGLVSIPLG